MDQLAFSLRNYVNIPVPEILVTSAYILRESAKFRATRGKNVLTCQRAFRAYVLSYQRASRAYVPTCLRVLRAHVPTCLARYLATCLLCSCTESISRSFFHHFIFLF